MKKRILAALVASAAVLSMTGCNGNNDSGSNSNNSNSNNSNSNQQSGNDNPGNSGDQPGSTEPVSGADFVVDKDNPQKIDTGITLSDSEGKVLNIWAWNDEYKGFFEKYYKVPDGITVNWIINPSDDGVYQQKLDEALPKQDGLGADEKIDMFLAEADYIGKYVDSGYTRDVLAMGVKNSSQVYQYTVDACSDSNGVQKGVSFQCCPAGVIFRRSIALEVLGTDDPALVQEQISTWDKFNAVAAKAKEMGYYMTPSYAETYRTFSTNASASWVDADDNVVVDPVIKEWVKQSKEYMDKGYTTEAGLWSDEKNAQMPKDGKTMCFFGPAWYYNFCMGSALDEVKNDAGEVTGNGPNNTIGDWGLCEGPQRYFWGGTWLLASSSTDNPELVADIMNAFQGDERIQKQLTEIDNQFVNSKSLNDTYAQDTSYGNAFLGGQNDTALFAELAKSIKFISSPYDQTCNEKFQNNMLEYFKGTVDLDTAWGNFKNDVSAMHPELTIPDTFSLD